MAMKLHVRVDVAGDYVQPLEAAQVLRVTARQRVASGAGLGEGDRVHTVRLTLAAGAHQDLALADGLADAFGRPIYLSRVRALWVRAADDNAHDVLVGGAPADAFAAPFADAGDQLRVRPGALAVLVAPGELAWPVTADADQLRIANAGGAEAVTVELILIGAKAGDTDFGDPGNPTFVLFLGNNR